MKVFGGVNIHFVRKSAALFISTPDMCNLELFFTHDGGGGASHATASEGTTDDTTTTASTTTSSSNSGSSVTFLHGPPHARLLSLLLQFGFSHARRGRSVVAVIYDTRGSGNTRSGAGGDAGRDVSPAPPKLDTAPLEPCACCGLPTPTGGDNLVWNRIQIKCVRSYEWWYSCV